MVGNGWKNCLRELRNEEMEMVCMSEKDVWV